MRASGSVVLMRFGAFVPQGWRIDLAGIEVDQHWPTMLGVSKDIESLGLGTEDTVVTGAEATVVSGTGATVVRGSSAPPSPC